MATDRSLRETSIDLGAEPWILAELIWMRGGLACDRHTRLLCAGSISYFSRDSFGRIVTLHSPYHDDVERYAVTKPLENFRALANAGSFYQYTCEWHSDGYPYIRAVGDEDAALLQCCQDYGLPTDARDFGTPLGVNSILIPEPARPDWIDEPEERRPQFVGHAEPGLRTTAFFAHICQTFVDLKNRKDWKSLKSYYQDTPDGMGTFLLDHPPYIGAFSLPQREHGERDSAYDARKLSAGVTVTILEICGWYLKDSLRVVVQGGLTESDAPRLVQAAAGLRSYLFLQFANAMNLTAVTRSSTKVCERCGEDFIPRLDHPRERTCRECQYKRDREKHKAKYHAEKKEAAHRTTMV